MAEFLLEIGCEEIPAPWLRDLESQLASAFVKLAAEAALGAVTPRVQSTPRRFILVATVPPRQADRSVDVWGPAVKVARDASGAWTPAALGFARKHGVPPEELAHGVKDPSKPNEKNLLYVQKIAGKPAAEVLPSILAALLRGLSFPKRMNWDAWLDDGKGAFSFGRPIRWIVALLDDAVVPFAIYESVDGARGPVLVQSGSATRGHRFLGPGQGAPITIHRASDLFEALTDNYVLASRQQRLDAIQRQLREVVGAGEITGAAWLAEEEWPDLAEYPTIVSGRVPAEFASLPVDVRNTVLAHHQKYVPFTTADGSMRFAALTNGDGSNAAEIARGMERVVVARLRDAAFFFAEDARGSLEGAFEKLAGITYHQGLGTYKDKAERMTGLVDAMHRHGLLDSEEHAVARSAARLSKVDLATLMVGEFPELQGVMGSLYLQREGASADLVHAVRWHYDGVPADRERGNAVVTASVSLADKLDTLAGHFGLGNIPSGSRDPYGLRRAAQEAVRAILEYWPERGQRPSLRSLVASAVDGAASSAKRPAAEIRADLEAFFHERLRYVLGVLGGPKDAAGKEQEPAWTADEIEAVLAAREPDPLTDPKECLPRLVALHRVRASARDDFEQLAMAFKRANNILKQAAFAQPWTYTASFSEPAEKSLFEALQAARASWRTDGGGMRAEDEYARRLRSLAGLRTVVDRFFDDVMVMVDDPEVRRTRLGLLGDLVQPFFQVADVSKLGGQA